MKTRFLPIFGVMILVIALVITGCAPAAPAKQRTIAYVAWNMNNPWSVKLRDSIKTVVESHGDKYVEADPAGDPAKQIPQMETFIGQKVDGIILTPTDKKALDGSVIAANAAGIPVVIAGAGIDEGPWKAAILTDNQLGGKQVGDWVVQHFNGKGKVLGANLPGIEDADLRQAGWESSFKGTQIQILDYQVGGSVELGVKMMENWLQKYATEFKNGEIVAVMGVNDPTALGALTVLEESKITNVFVVGIDGSDEAIKAMTDCRNYGASAEQKPVDMGKMAADTLYDVFAGKAIANRIVRIPTAALLRESYCKK
jgi:ribose transport system substrate-binding protein